MHGLTGTNLQYHLSVDLMVDDDWTTGESKRGVRLTAGGKVLLQLRLGEHPFLTLEISQRDEGHIYFYWPLDQHTVREKTLLCNQS